MHKIKYILKISENFNFFTRKYLPKESLIYKLAYEKLISMQIDYLNDNIKNIDFYKLTYNIFRNYYYNVTNHFLELIKLETSTKHFTHQDFFNFSVKMLSLSPVEQNLDKHLVTATHLLHSFMQSYCILYQYNEDFLADIDDILIRLELTLKKADNLLKKSKEKTIFISPKQIFQFSDSIENINIFTKSKPNSILEDVIPIINNHENLYTYLYNILNTVETDEILDKKDIIQLKNSLDKDKLSIYEKLVDFDFDEFSNSVKNSVNSIRRYKKLNKKIPKNLYINFTSSFNNEIKDIDINIIPMKHNFYSLIDENDKGRLINFIINLIELNNRYCGINSKVAFSLLSKSDIPFSVKKESFKLASHLADKYIYGLYLEDISQYQEYEKKFILNITSLIIEIINKDESINLVQHYLSMFLNALSWFIIHAGGYGMVTLFNKNTVQTLSGRSNFEAFLSNPNHRLIPPISLNILKDEYATSSFIQLIDIRCKKGFIKYNNFESYQQEILNLAHDLREMRRLLIKNFKAKDTIIELDIPLTSTEKTSLQYAKKLYALWQWETNGDSLGRICFGESYEYMLTQAEKPSRIDASYIRLLRVNWDGLLSAIETPWLDASNMYIIGVDAIEELNLYLLQKFHEMFYEQYAHVAQKVKKSIYKVQIEPKKVNLIINESNEEVNVPIYDNYDVETIQLQDILQNEYAQNNLDTTNTYFNISMKSSKFFKILTEKFDVKVKSGKGSEINVSRATHGGKTYRLGHHGNIVEYNSSLIRQVLRRLNISIEEFQIAYYNK